MQRVELGVEQCASSFEMSDCGRAIPVAVLQNREHGMAGRIARTQPQQAIEQWHGVATASLIVQLSGALQGRGVIRRKTQRFVERRKGRSRVAFFRERDALQRPQLRVVGRIS